MVDYIEFPFYCKNKHKKVIISTEEKFYIKMREERSICVQGRCLEGEKCTEHCKYSWN